MAKTSILELNSTNTQLLIIDYQEKLFPHVFHSGEILPRVELMIKFARMANLPMVVSEQYPKGLGKTIDELSSLLKESSDYKPFPKTSFNCFGNEALKETLKKSGKQNLLIMGIETHICVLQTLLAAIREDFKVFLLVDTVGSRDKQDHNFALMQAETAGAVLTTVETVIYQLVKNSKYPRFKEVIDLITTRETEE